MTTEDETAPASPNAPTPPASDATPAAATPTPVTEGNAGGTAASLLESAAEIAIGAAVAPFTGGETVGIVASLTEALEGGVDRLTHLGHHVQKSENEDAAESGGQQDPPA